MGDPCEPEAIPVDSAGNRGFDSTEAYLETSSVQCRTRVCMVYRLNGLPFEPGSEECSDSNEACNSAETIEQKVYCTCRCDTAEGVSGETCSCPSGYRCVPVLDSEGAGGGIRGSYCCDQDDPDCEAAFIQSRNADES
ncbi:MAG: hypothetical protein AAF355_06290 [Myxococcota bacterium]